MILRNMRKILVNFSCAFIPFKQVRKNFRRRYLRGNLFGSLPDVFDEIKIKRDAIGRSVDKEDFVLAVGSSHGAFGFDPLLVGKNVFNLCSNSQDLYTMYSVILYWVNKLTSISTIIAFVDVFHRGFQLDRTSAQHICAAYSYLYGFVYPSLPHKEMWARQCRALDTKNGNVMFSRNGYLMPPQMPCFGTVSERVRVHMREHDRSVSQYCWLAKMLALAKDRNINVVLMIPPLRKDYRELLKIDIEAELLGLDSSVKILNYSKDADFVDADFYDFDHLNNIGAQKLSLKIKEALFGQGRMQL